MSKIIQKENRPASVSLHVGIMELMKAKAKSEYEYINPYFLTEITKLLEEYYQLEDCEVDDWVQGMWSA